MWENIRGHHRQVAMFRRAIHRGRTAHTYLFVGPTGIGKKLFARMMSQCLFCENIADSEFEACGKCSSCVQMQAGTHPDFLMIGCPEGKRELPIELVIGSKENRGRAGLCHELSLKPMSASRKIALIDDAETMNEASANSLLKTLEEPPSGVILFLISPETDPILPTIRSRCQTVRFSPLADQDIAELLFESKEVATIDQARAISCFSEGSLTKAIQLLDPGLLEIKQTITNCLQRFPIDSLQSVSQVKAVFDKIGGDTSAERQHMRWANEFLIEELRRLLVEATEPYKTDQLAAMLDRAFEVENHLKQTMPVGLCLEAVLDDLSRLSRTPVVVE